MRIYRAFIYMQSQCEADVGYSDERLLQLREKLLINNRNFWTIMLCCTILFQKPANKLLHGLSQSAPLRYINNWFFHLRFALAGEKQEVPC
jgi:hypothetical protein